MRAEYVLVANSLSTRWKIITRQTLFSVLEYEELLLLMNCFKHRDQACGYEEEGAISTEAQRSSKS